MARPPRVIHLVENLNVGAIENWLVRMLRHADTRDVPTDWTFYCTLGRPGVLDEQARDLGARVILSPAPLNDWARFVGALRAELRDGAYDVMHAHHDLVSGSTWARRRGWGSVEGSCTCTTPTNSCPRQAD